MILLFLACNLGSTSARVSTGECEGSPYDTLSRQPVAGDVSDDLTTSGSGTVDIHVEDGVLVLDYLDMTANCCPSPEATVEIGEGQVAVDLVDVTDNRPCDCVCITDFEVEVRDLAPGAWQVEALFNGALVGGADIET